MVRSHAIRSCVFSGALFLAGCSGSTTAAPPAGAMFRGADISALERIEQAGGRFRDSGRVDDAIAILRVHGANGFRLRLFVSPNDSDVQVNDPPYPPRL